MSDETTTLHAAVAQRLFGFHITAGVHGFTLWKDAAGTIHHAIPAYTTNPAATAQVWQWVERALPVSRVDRYTQRLMIFIARGDLVRCEIDAQWVGEGATWPEALCRAALALAEALEGGEARGDQTAYHQETC